MDTMSPAARSRVMSKIRSKHTKPELIVRGIVASLGLEFDLHDARLPGTPDVIVPIASCAIFVHGCFWHNHDCGRFRMPRTNVAYWSAKFDGNRRRDVQFRRELRALGWRSTIVWECELRERVAHARYGSISPRARLVRRLARFLGRACDVASAERRRL